MSCSLREQLQEGSVTKAATVKLNEELKKLVADLQHSSIVSDAARDAATTALVEYREQVSV